MPEYERSQAMTNVESDSTSRAGRRKLPLGIQTFRKIREEGCYDVDKTDYARRLVEGVPTTFSPARGGLARACSSTP